MLDPDYDRLSIDIDYVTPREFDLIVLGLSALPSSGEVKTLIHLLKNLVK